MMAMAMIAGTPAISSQAAGLTQAVTPEEVTYGTLTAEDIEIIKSMFDYEYYKSQNPDLANVIGSDFDSLFKHFCLCGIFEGRTCSENFDPAAYASAYDDLKSQFGKNIVKYYEHFAKFAAAENRTITNVAAAAEAGITVQGLVSDDVKISPAAYMLAVKLGTTDFATVEKAVSESVRAEAEAKGDSAGAGGIVATKKQIDPILAEAQGLKLVGTIKPSESSTITSSSTGDDSLYLYIIKADSDYAAYDRKTTYNEEFDYYYLDMSKIAEYEPVYTTANYDVKEAKTVEKVGELQVYTYLKSSSTSSSTDYDPTLQPHYELTNVKGEYAKTGANISSYYSDGYNFIGYDSEKQEGTNIIYKAKDDANVKASNEWEATDTLDGYYADKNGTVHKFTDENDKAEWLEMYKQKKIEEERKYCEEHNYPFDPSTYTFYAPDDTNSWTSYQDPLATKDTVYDVGLKIEENENGNVEVTVGVSNKDDNFGYVATYEVEKKTETY